MTTPVAPPLLNVNDLAQFQASDPNWFLTKAGEVIRAFCQWHIAPSITVTDSVPIAPDGTIMLPSLYVTGVGSVSIHGLQMDPTTYHWHQAGYIKRHRRDYWEWPLWPLQSDKPFREYPSPLALHAQVTYTHGYPTIPDVVADVGMEVDRKSVV